MSEINFYCQNCFNTFSVDLSCIDAAASELDDVFKSARSGMFNSMPGFICPECGCYHSTFLIDTDMSEIISLLNSRGYETVACCSGHNRDNPFHTQSGDAYVLIKYSKTLEKYLKICKKYKMIEALTDSGIEFSVSVQKWKEQDSTIRIGVSYNDYWLSYNGIEKVSSKYLSSRIIGILLAVPVNRDKKNGIMTKNTYRDADGNPYLEN